MLRWSRASFLDFSETQALPALLRCHEHAFHYLGGVPEEILYDRMKTVWLQEDQRGAPVFHRDARLRAALWISAAALSRIRG